MDSLNKKTVYYKEEHIFMGRKRKFIPEEKLKVVETILNGIDLACNQARLRGIDRKSIQ